MNRVGLGEMADGDRNAELSNANKSLADGRVNGDPPRSSPRRRAASTQIPASPSRYALEAGEAVDEAPVRGGSMFRRAAVPGSGIRATGEGGRGRGVASPVFNETWFMIVPVVASPDSSI
jgi:hypothetical protein